jgi:uncharacterized YigZ family protein
MQYATIDNVENCIHTDKGSKFIGYAYAVLDEAMIKERLSLVKNSHPRATHHCFAYRLGIDKNNFRMNDDGEPARTAGKPILGQIDSFKVTNCLVIVVRYFGGTKLGVSGLIAAYKETARLTLSTAEIIHCETKYYYGLRCSYERINRLYTIVQAYAAEISERDINIDSSFVIAVNESQREALERKLQEEQIEFKYIGHK